MLSDDVKMIEQEIVEESALAEVVAAWNRIKTALVKLDTTPNKQSAQGCVICGCNISLRGYCSGCQTRVD